MTTLESAVIFPLLPGKRPALEQFVQALAERQEEHDETHINVGYESLFLQETQKGDMVIVYLQARDVLDVFTKMALSTTPFAHWFREQVLELTGMDLVLLPPFSLPERIFHRIR